MVEVKFCENNFIHGTEDVSNQLEEEFPDIQVEVEPCLGYCSDCANGPFALVNGEMVQAESDEKLYEIVGGMLDGEDEEDDEDDPFDV
ncbi:MAG TPA: DUF1450 domain-containing protein [Bacillota bacterium]